MSDESNHSVNAARSPQGKRMTISLRHGWVGGMSTLRLNMGDRRHRQASSNELKETRFSCSPREHGPRTVWNASVPGTLPREIRRACQRCVSFSCCSWHWFSCYRAPSRQQTCPRPHTMSPRKFLTRELHLFPARCGSSMFRAVSSKVCFVRAIQVTSCQRARDSHHTMYAPHTSSPFPYLT